MSRTDKTTPASVQIQRQMDKRGYVDWNSIAWRRYKGHGEWINNIAHRHDDDYSIDEGIEDYYTMKEEEDEGQQDGCFYCSDH